MAVYTGDAQTLPRWVYPLLVDSARGGTVRSGVELWRGRTGGHFWRQGHVIIHIVKVSVGEDLPVVCR